MRGRSASDAAVTGSGEAFAPSLSDARIYARNRTLVLSHKSVWRLLFHATTLKAFYPETAWQDDDAKGIDDALVEVSFREAHGAQRG